MLVTSASTNIIPLMESFSAYPKWISLAIRIFNTSSGGASEVMFDILVRFLVSPQTYIENYTPYLHKYTFQIWEIKQIRIRTFILLPALTDTRTVHGSPRCIHATCHDQCTTCWTHTGVTTTRCHPSAIHIYLAANPEITQTDCNHGCYFTDKRSILPWIRGVFTADIDVWVWKHAMRLGVVFGSGYVRDMCDQAR